MADVNTIAEYIYRRAPLYGVDPNLAVGIARYEGLNPNTLGSATFGNRDARGYSFGPFQLYSGSSDPTKIAPGGMAYEFQQRYGQVPSRENWMQQVDFSLETMKNKGTSPWYAVRDQGGVEAITKKGATFAGSLGLLGGGQEQNQPRNALIALGTNDYTNPQAAAEATQRAIDAARSRGLTPIIVPPNADNDKFKAVSNAVRTAASNSGATIAVGTYDPKDPLHLTMESARQLGQQYPGAIPIGDSNAVRIGMGLGYKPAAEGSQIVNPQGVVLAQTGLDSSAIAQNIMGLPELKTPAMPTQQRQPATQMADIKGYLAPAAAENLAPAGTWARFGQDLLGGATGGLLGTPWSTPAANAPQPTQVASMAPVNIPAVQPQFPSATPGMAGSVALPASVGQPTMPQMAGLNVGAGYQAPPASAMQPAAASQSLFNMPTASTPGAVAGNIANIASIGASLMAAGAPRQTWQPGAPAPVHRGQWRDNIFEGLLG
jgi:hypothetical protein